MTTSTEIVAAVPRPGVVRLRRVAQAAAPQPDRTDEMATKKLPYDVARIRARCALAGITPLDLSRACDVHHSVINRWLHGETMPTLRTLEKFDAYLDTLRVAGTRRRVPRVPKIPKELFEMVALLPA